MLHLEIWLARNDFGTQYKSITIAFGQLKPFSVHKSNNEENVSKNKKLVHNNKTTLL